MGRGLDEVNARLRRMEFVGGPGARRGLQLVQNGMRGLAFDAIGLRGPLGQVTEALFQLGGGKGAALLAAAGIGAIAGAYRLATADARELAKANEELVKSYDNVLIGSRSAARGLIESRNAILAAERDLASVQRRRQVAPLIGLLEGGTEEQARQNVLRAERNRRAQLDAFVRDRTRAMQDAELERRPAFAQQVIGAIAHLAPDDRLTVLRQQRPVFEALGDEAGRIWAEAWIKAVEESLGAGPSVADVRQTTRAIRAGRGPTIQLAPFGLGLAQGSASDLLRGNRAAFAAEMRASVGASFADFDADRRARLRQAGTEMFGRIETPQARFDRRLTELRDASREGLFAAEGTEEWAQAVKLLRDEMDQARALTPQLGLAIVSMVSGAVNALSTGNVGGFLIAAGGVAGAGVKGVFAANPALGFGLSIAGGLFSLFDRSEERRHRELVEAVNRAGREVGLERVRVVVVDARGNVMQELQREEGHDAVSRVPGYAGATG